MHRNSPCLHEEFNMDQKSYLNHHDNNSNNINNADMINILKQSQLSKSKRSSMIIRENERGAKEHCNEYDYPDDR